MSDTPTMPWEYSHRFAARALPLADRHYNRRKVGSPQFVPPGRCVVLLTANADALWVTSWPFAAYVRHDWPGAWVNALFRNESPTLSSSLIRAAVAATRHRYGEPPELGIISFIDPAQTRRKRDPGRCYIRAGWHYPTCAYCDGAKCGLCLHTGKAHTKGGLRVVQQLRNEMPAAMAPRGVQLSLGAA